MSVLPRLHEGLVAVPRLFRQPEVCVDYVPLWRNVPPCVPDSLVIPKSAKWGVAGDEELQQRVWSLLEAMEPNEKFRPGTGAEFLHQNRELLD